ncbi:MAG: nucleoside:proton symporter [Rhodospirillaceae bacterium]|jgi:concentrative nucleoside transporter, CNT family|nr:nucleoside:proton symporter [Rhodospirillaceae bacterium]MBT5373822.1 nucleoside:proton symporter [Rhodospirillaceae bacterium]MBT5659761.1 nucleoside:proton symporter [Rhodospirillaceae bacterium]MBT5751094.1 nucleoside:proton symporter [Rhodospirillaceae bacterium]
MISQSLIGFLAIPLLAFTISEKRSAVRPRLILAGLFLQVAMALILLRLPTVRAGFLELNRVVTALQDATTAGTSFVFGYIGGSPPPFAETGIGSAFVFAFQVMPLVLVISALSALLFHWRILPMLVRGAARLLEKTLQLGGAVGVSAAANIFMGMVEAPLLVRPYLAKLSRSELFMVMTCGMATIAGTMMILYASMLKDVLPGALGHLLTASIINLPAAITISRLMVPDQDKPTAGDIALPRRDKSAMDAIVRGTLEGVELLINILALLIVLVALVALTNQILGALPDIHGTTLTLQGILGFLLSPLAWAMGIPWAEAQAAGGLLGTKLVLTELVAYADMAKSGAQTLSPHSRVIMTYALCGFANFASLGILIGGMGAMVPERREDIVNLGVKSVAAGTLATCLTGAVIGMIL